jgi:hypothetical protein
MSALMLASAYAAGAYYFSRAALARPAYTCEVVELVTAERRPSR